jgi:hypothetical protein
MKKWLLATTAGAVLAFSGVATAAAPTVTLQQDLDTVIYGGTVSLSGQISPAAANQQVTITQMPQNRAARSIVVTTDSAGAFSYDISPRFNTRVVATYGTTQSDELNVWVRARVVLAKNGHHRYVVRVFAGRPFVGRYVWVTRWNTHTHSWRNLFRIRLKHYVRNGGASTATFKLNVSKRTKLRAMLNNAAARPDYVRSWSNFVVS